MIYLIVETSSKSGIDTWNSFFIKTINTQNEECTLINVNEWTDKGMNIHDSIIVLNNVRNKDIVNKDVLTKLNDNNNRLYFVIHGDICPVNKTFAYFSKLFHGVISISKKVKSIIMKHYPNKHVIYFPNKVEYPTKEKKVLNKDNINFGYVGRISKEKNIPLILRAIKKYQLVNKNCKLHLFGSGMSKPHHDYVNELIDILELQDTVIQYGHVEDLDDIYDKIDILLLPSVSEGIPYCIIESSYYGIPVVATDVGCISEIVKDNVNGKLFKLEGYPYIKGIFIHNYEYILYRTGYTAYIRGTNGKEVTDTKLHVCDKKICATSDDTGIIAAIDCRINNSICNACMELLSKKMIFQKNIDRLTEQMMYVVDNFESFNVTPIYQNVDLNTPIIELLEDKMISIDKLEEYYPFAKSEYEMVIDTKESYGKYYMQLLRPLPYIVSIKYKLKGNCYMFICESNKNFPFIVTNLDGSGEKIMKVRITKPGHYKIGIRFRDDCTDGLLEVKSFNIKMYNVDMPTRNGFNLSRYDLKVADRNRYNEKQDISKIMFMFITCNY